MRELSRDGRLAHAVGDRRGQPAPRPRDRQLRALRRAALEAAQRIPRQLRLAALRGQQRIGGAQGAGCRAVAGDVVGTVAAAGRAVEIGAGIRRAVLPARGILLAEPVGEPHRLGADAGLVAAHVELGDLQPRGPVVGVGPGARGVEVAQALGLRDALEDPPCLIGRRAVDDLAASGDFDGRDLHGAVGAVAESLEDPAGVLHG